MSGIGSRITAGVILLAALQISGCSPNRAAETGTFSVCGAIDKGSQLVGKEISIRGWISTSGHSTILGDATCPSDARIQYLHATRAPGEIPIRLADPADQRSQEVKSDFPKYPTWPDGVGFRGTFRGKLVARQLHGEPSAHEPETSMVPYTFVIDTIDEFKVERPPFMPPHPRRATR